MRPMEQEEKKHGIGKIVSVLGSKTVNCSGTCNKFEVELKEVEAGSPCTGCGGGFK